MRRKTGSKGRARHHGNRRGRRRSAIRDDAVTRQILDFFEDKPNLTVRVKDLIAELATSARHERQLRDTVTSLIDIGRLRRVKGRKVCLADDSVPMRGRLELAEGGFGFVRFENGEDDLFIPPSKLHGAGHGDKVEVMVTGYGRNGRQQGRVIRVLERDDTPVIGRFVGFPGRGGLVYPDNPKLPGPVEVPASQRRGAKDGDRVQVDMEHGRRRPHGRVVRVFGPADDPQARLLALIAEFKFREHFAGAALEEADNETGEITAEELATRRTDLRDRLIVTIDPESAHDFDDAISMRKVKGGYELGVHIADVSWYVREESALDKEARMRGTSVYTSHGTLPMLPERLSSDLCSLREGVDRRTVSVFMRVTPDGYVSGGKIVRSVIRSRKRFTYAQVQELIEQGRERWGEALPPLRKDSLPAFIHHLATLTAWMRRRRFEQGGFNLNVPEFEVKVDETNEPVAIVRRPVHESNHVVEECMLAANRAVTEFANRQRGAGAKAFVYRVHDRPDPEELHDFAAQVDALGVDWTLGSNFDQIGAKALNEWLESLNSHPLGEVIQILALRAMAKAVYDTQNIGHYGLGFANYTHFTSPIRRYPDLIVHRILLAHIEHRAKYGPDTEQELQRTCELASERERAAQEMERKSLKIRQAEYFSKQVGEVFEGMITKAIPKGVFVEIAETGAQGMIQADDLGAVYYDRELMAFVEIGGSELFRPGKRIKVRVQSADPDLGRVELEPA